VPPLVFPDRDRPRVEGAEEGEGLGTIRSARKLALEQKLLPSLLKQQ
jgi:hypothetical protein